MVWREDNQIRVEGCINFQKNGKKLRKSYMQISKWLGKVSDLRSGGFYNITLAKVCSLTGLDKNPMINS